MRNYLLLSAIALLAACSSNPTETTVVASTPASAARPITSQSLADMNGMLATHNRIRQQHNLLPLEWSDRMADYAKEWAGHLAKNGCNMAHRSAAGRNPIKAGENIFWAAPITWSDGRASNLQKVSASEVAMFWASEQTDYNYQTNRCRPGKQCGHYTQMVWKTTKQVGCGAAMCPGKGQIWVCNYDPAGNWVGRKPY